MKRTLQLILAGLLTVALVTSPAWGMAKLGNVFDRLIVVQGGRLCVNEACTVYATFDGVNTSWVGSNLINLNGAFFAQTVIVGNGTGGISTNGNSTLDLSSSNPDGAAAIGVKVRSTAHTTAGAKIASFQNATTEKAAVDKDGFWLNTVQSFSVADDGAGTAASGTLTPTSPYVTCTCNDANGCNVTMGETGMQNSALIQIVTLSTNACNFADTAGVSETAGAFAAGQYDVINLMYVSDRWVEVGRSNN